MKRNPRMPLVSEATMIMSLEGHLFDSGLINQTLMSWKRINAVLEQCVFLSTRQNGRSKSSVLLRITSSDEAVLSRVESKIATLVDVIEKRKQPW
jgi:ribosomal protein L17